MTMLQDAPERVETTYRPRRPVRLVSTVGMHQRGPGDPSQYVHGEVVWRAVRTPVGAAALALRQQSDGEVRAAAWGAGRHWALAQVPELCGAADDRTGFDPSGHPLIARTAARFPHLSLSRSDLPVTALAQAVIEQKVTVEQAFGAWRALVRRFGERMDCPAPRPLYAPPSIQGWRMIPSWDWHRAGLEPPQSRTLVAAARRGASLEEALTPSTADRVLRSLPGVGPWTSAETRIRAFGDPDAVSIGDFHLAHRVGYALTGSRTDDDGMLDLLEPWRGHRQRVIRLIGLSGVVEPRRAPKLHREDHRDR